MRFISLLMLLPIFMEAQNLSEDKMTAVTYLYSFAVNESDQQLRQENMNLLINGQESSFQSYNLRVMDSLMLDMKEDDFNDPKMVAARGKYRYFNKYNIHITENDVTFQSKLGLNEYVYEEKLALDWKLGSETKEIMGYTCKNATVIYGGRQWKAWYATNLPLNAGPYKFKGLPGLILKATDITGNFDFEAILIGSKTKAVLEYGFHSKTENERINTTKEEFNKIQRSFESMSLNEKMSFGNPNGSVKLMVTRPNGGGEDKTMNRKMDQAPKRKRVFIEKLNTD